MYKRNVFKNLLKRMPNNEQSANERKLIAILKELEIEDYKFNWDRTSCYVEFYYDEYVYRLEHSVEKARKKGIVLHNGLDCLVELTQSLEDLCSIVDRGLGDFETWIAGMKLSPLESILSENKEEREMNDNTIESQPDAEYISEEPKELTEPITFGRRHIRREMERNERNQRAFVDEVRF